MFNKYKNLFSAFLGGGATAVFNIISIPVLINSLGLESYGMLVLLITVIAIASVLFSLQPWQGMIKYWYEKDISKNALTSLVLYIEVVSLTLASITIFIFIKSEFFSKYFFDVSHYAQIFIAFSLLLNPHNFFIGLFRVNDNFLELSLSEFFRGGVRFLGALYTQYEPTIEVYLFFYLMSNLIANLFLLYRARLMLLNGSFSFISINNIRKLNWIKSFFNFSFFVSLKSILDLPVQQIDKVLVSVTLGSGSVALLEVAKKINQGFGLIFNTISQVYFPALSKKVKGTSMEYLFNYYLKVSIKVFFIIVIFSVFFYLFKPFILDMISNSMGRVDLADFNALFVYVGLFLLSSSFILIHVLFLAYGYVKQDVKILVWANLIYLAIIYTFADTIGLMAIVYAYLSQVVIVIGFKVYFLKKKVKEFLEE